MFRSRAVGVTYNNHRWGGDRADLIRRPVEGLAVQLLHLLYQRREGVRIRRDPIVLLLPRAAGEELGGDLLDASPDLGVDAVAGRRSRNDDQLPYERRVPHRELESRTTPHAVAEDVGPLDAEVSQQGGDI